MCGIVGAIAQRNVANILLECLKRLEYRGYDSAGIVVLDNKHNFQRLRTTNRIDSLIEKLHAHQLNSHIGISHTRWATHGKPSENNAHPLISNDQIALVHNGIIENYQELRQELTKDGYQFVTETDTEVIAHCIHKYCAKGHDFLTAIAHARKELEGAYALAIINNAEPNKIIVVRSGSPVVIGIGIGENFVASDAIALAPVTSQFIYLEEGDIAEMTRDKITVYDSKMQLVKRPIKTAEFSKNNIDRGNYRHFMQKEIFEQPISVADTIEARITSDHVLVEAFGNHAKKVISKVKRIQIVACGSSYFAAMAGRYWLEQYAQVPCKVEIASEIRYRQAVVEPDTLFITISQSGETADTLAALRQAKNLPYIATMTICNVPESSLVRESDLVFMTRAGTEVGVATTKGFTTQLTALLMLTAALSPDHQFVANVVKQLKHLPTAIESALALDEQIAGIATRFMTKQNAFFLGRGIFYPIAMEGALKMKEISYLHAEAYPAGELKHGPLALIDKDMPVVVIAPNDNLIEKLKSNLHEVRARSGELFVFADQTINLQNEPGWTICKLPNVAAEIAPIAYTIPLQLLAYHVAVLKGTDVDRPRNLAKSVTVE